MKACESFHMLTSAVLQESSELVDMLKQKMAILNPEYYGAVPLLGINGTVLKAHGGSSSIAIKNAVITALAAAKGNSPGSHLPDER